MYDEDRALSLLKRSIMVKGKDSLKRAPEYEVLKGGMTMFFRNGYGDVYEISSQGDFINGYPEEYLDEALDLKKYCGQVMRKNDIQNFLDKEELIKLRDEKVGTVIDVCFAVNKNLEENKEIYDAVREAFKDAFVKERQEGINEEKERVVSNMLKEGYSIKAIAKICQLSEDVIRSIAVNLGLNIAG